MTLEDFFILAATTFNEQVKAETHGERFNSRDVLMALTIAMAVGFCIVVWVYFHYRKKRDRQDKERLNRKIVSSPPRADSDSTESGSGERRRIRKRRRRRDHRPRNPSLHQTGGLPPHRPDDELPKY
jgi:hypothetical protein